MIKVKTYYDWEHVQRTNPLGPCYTVPALPIRLPRRPGTWWDQRWSLVQDSVGRYLADFYFPRQTEGPELDFSTYTITYEGDVLLNPPSPFIVRHRVTEKASNFRELCEAGVIVMNNYEVSSFLLKPVIGEVPLSSSIAGSVSLDSGNYRQFINDFSYVYITAHDDRPDREEQKRSFECLHVGGRWMHQAANTGSVPIRIDKSESSYAPPALAKQIIENNRRFRGFDSVLIQQNTASANNGDADALTALAEMPETIESIVDGFLLLKKGAIAARSRQLVVTKQHAKKAKARRDREFGHNAQFPSRRTFVKRGGDPKDYDTFKETFLKSNRKDRTEYAKRRIEQLRLQEAEELGNAVSGVWLNYRYNISPTVYMIQDTIKAMQRLLDMYKTTRSMNNHYENLSLPTGWHFDGDFHVQDRVTTKRLYSFGDKLDRLSRAFGFDVFVTMLERVPLWGIVVNWFVTAADFLRALNWDPKHNQSVTCFSQKITIRGKLIFGPNHPTSPSWDVDGAAYYRKVIDPVDHLGIHIKLNITSERKIDALAFLWSKDSKNYLKR